LAQPKPPARTWRWWLNACSGESALIRYQVPGFLSSVTLAARSGGYMRES
jgi:hypothetical protein